MAEQRTNRKLAAILATDVVGYSRLMSRDEAGTLARLKELRRQIVDPGIAAYAGRIVKLMGDGMLAEFASAVDAVACATHIQKAVRDRNAALPEDRRIELRVGINVGDIIVDGDDIYGDGVNLAARIEGLAEPGGVLISRSAFDQVRDKIASGIEPGGEHTVKNIARPVEVFRVLLDPAGAGSKPDARASGPDAAGPPHKSSVAVLAFNNMSGDAEQEYFSDGISEDIITDLSKVSDLHVIARNSSFVYKGANTVSIPQVARELGVLYVLEGSVRKAGNRVRVTAQLIDAATGGHLWADRFDRDLTDIFTVQDELTREIVSALKVSLSADDQQRLARRRIVDVDAYNLFLRGREQLWLHNRVGNIEARRLLAAAVAKEPGYVAARAGIAISHVLDYVNEWSVDPAVSLRVGVELAEEAVGMDADEPEAQFALTVACLWNRELDRSLSAAARCLELKPGSAQGHLALAHPQIFNAEPSAAIENIEAAMRLDPHYPDILLHFLAEAHISLGRFDTAVEVLKRRLERDPDSKTAHILLASCYGHLGRIDEARAAWSKVQSIDPGFDIVIRGNVLPFRDPADFEVRVDGIRKAGLLD